MWQSTPVFLPREFPWTEEPGGHSPWGHKESDRTEQPSTAQHSTLNRKFWLLMATVEHSQLSAPGFSSYQDPKSFSSLCQTALSSRRRRWMAPHSSTIAWKIPWMVEPGRCCSPWGREESDIEDFTFTFLHWRRKWQPTPVFLLGEPQGWGSLVGCRLWGRTELDTTEAT